MWDLRWDMRSSLELNRRPQNSFPCIQLHMYGEAPPGGPLDVAAGDFDGGCAEDKEEAGL